MPNPPHLLPYGAAKAARGRRLLLLAIAVLLAGAAGPPVREVDDPPFRVERRLCRPFDGGEKLARQTARNPGEVSGIEPDMSSVAVDDALITYRRNPAWDELAVRVLLTADASKEIPLFVGHVTRDDGVVRLVSVSTI